MHGVRWPMDHYGLHKCRDLQLIIQGVESSDMLQQRRETRKTSIREQRPHFVWREPAIGATHPGPAPGRIVGKRALFPMSAQSLSIERHAS